LAVRLLPVRGGREMVEERGRQGIGSQERWIASLVMVGN
jgi:hypothetical protein